MSVDTEVFIRFDPVLDGGAVQSRGSDVRDQRAEGEGPPARVRE